jgi:thiamine-phosphate pyrophosphorylase
VKSEKLKAKKQRRLHKGINALCSEAVVNSAFRSPRSSFRVADANLNRCREGLRVVEDCLRYVLNDAVLYKKIRALRHETDKILRDFYAVLIKERDSISDGGRSMPETLKKELPAIIIANFKRAQESLRVLEEYSKTVFPKAAAEFKKQRYIAYNLEKKAYLKHKKIFKIGSPITNFRDSLCHLDLR